MIKKLATLHKDIKDLRKSVKTENLKRISKKSIRSKAEELGNSWFSEYSEVLLNIHGISADLIKKYSQSFERLIKISAPSNLKSSYIETLNEINKNFRDDLILPIQKNPKAGSDITLLSKIFKDMEDELENEYLQEATDCAKHKYYRAAVVLGWCATIDRIHKTIEKNGFATFNATSASMSSQTKGRFKKFNKTQNIPSINELRTVFDTVILWVLEGMGIIDNNQHTRLRSCFNLRCHCAHPGEAPITEYNLLSYFSDLKEIVFKNTKFSI